MKLMPLSTAVWTARIPSSSRMEWKTPPNDEAPKPRFDTRIPVSPISLYTIFLNLEHPYFFRCASVSLRLAL